MGASGALSCPATASARSRCCARSRAPRPSSPSATSNCSRSTATSSSPRSPATTARSPPVTTSSNGALPESDGLSLPPEAMRALGYQAVDLLVERLSDPSIPALRRATPAEMAARVAGPPPDGARSFDDVLAQLQADVLPFMNRADHPRFFAFIPSCQTFPGALGDFIASALNVYVGSWMEAAGPSQVELTVLDWFKDWLGFPPASAGLLLSGGSAANMT